MATGIKENNSLIKILHLLSKILAGISLLAIPIGFDRWQDMYDSILGNINENLPDVLIILLISVGGLAGIIEIIRRIKKSDSNIPLEYKKRHTSTLAEVYKRIAEVHVSRRHGKFMRLYPSELIDPKIKLVEHMRGNYKTTPDIAEPYLKFNTNYEYFDSALEHLSNKKYKNIYSHWKKADKLINELNNEPNFEELLQTKINELMTTNFPDFKKMIGHSYDDHFYDVRAISQYILDCLKTYDDKNYELWFHDLFIDTLGRSQHCIAIKREYIIPYMGSIDKNKLDLGLYQKILVQIVSDHFIQKSLKKQNEKTILISQEFAQFKEELKKLITGLKDIQIIEGKCDICR